jgi:hypothetical protein
MSLIVKTIMERPNLPVGVVMERRTVVSGRWESQRWEPVGVVPDPGGNPHVIFEEPQRVRWMHPGFAVTLFRDEAEGYYLNLSTDTPYVFVMWREEEGIGVPKIVTVSYNEAARMMDGGESVDGVAMPAEMASWVAAFADEHYKPEPKRRIRPPSFKGARRSSDEGAA